MKIEELHNRLFEVLCTIDDICKENNLRWFLDSGTELGSVREKDFISWDDDMDIKIFAEDLDRFIEVMNEKLPEHMHIVKPDVFKPYFYDFVVRIYDDRYLIRNETEEDRAYGNYQNRVGTDVFLLQKVPDSAVLQKLAILRLKVLYGMGMAYRYSLDNFEKYSFLQKIGVKLLSWAGKLTSLDKILMKYEKFARKWEKKQTGFRMISNYPLQFLKIVPDSAFSGTTYGTIRGRVFPIPSGYDTELTINYGDYLTPQRNEELYVTHLDSEDR